ncbi:MULTISPECIES: IclR family transcriptional regulator [Thalassospira]|uniref:IclR family transcriptional regulator n=1 Tax=Thalassospira TaxID=168934 RepID=UPI0008DCD98A|nr:MULTISPECIES: IclR family transcriptional regulator [Thalassospira]MAB35515.1 IclR family transcriptional regulator [Thalassospira sp.]MDM7978648.1 IclR family transcriptional regulator [Thalassospira xiamenensis]OHZ01688.1 IclR family transcriptional regulator [Thalassospira sp. MIT1004]HBS25062.1 IclR family transcriptional regulator [Thalassospira sp.]|tara:strand:- start:138 stop:899 length:762 start_codon:yes stop_codon:yes gene_type:complete
MPSQLNGSVLKAFRILELFAEGRTELTASDTAAALGINTITAHRFLHTLEQAGALRMVARGVFRLGYVFADLGDRVLRDGSLPNLIQPVLDDLARNVGDACMATEFDRDMAVCIAKALPDRSLYVDIRIGSRLDAFCTAHGKLWLAFMGPDQQDRYFDSIRLTGMTDRTITDLAALKSELRTIREQGFSMNNGERESDIYAVAVPILTQHGRMVSAISVFGASPTLIEQKRDHILTSLRDAAENATRALYGHF